MNAGNQDKETRGQGDKERSEKRGARNAKELSTFNFQLSTSAPRILIIKPSAIGDVVHTLPILNLVRRRWPQAHISWLVTPGCAGLLEGHPQLDQVIHFDRKRLGTILTRPWRILELRRFTRSLRRMQFDLVLDLQGLFRSGWLGWRTGSPVRVGLSNAREFAWMFYTHRASVTWDQHAVDRYLQLAKFIGCEPGPVEFKFATTDADRQYVDQLLTNAGRPIGPFAVVLPATNWPTKRWPIERFAALVEPLKKEFGLSTVLAGGPDAIEMAPKIPQAMNLAGKTSLRQLTALLEKAALVIANDSGPMHIAAALGRPLVTVFGPTNPYRTGPFGRMDSVVRAQIECGPCYCRRCSHQSCLRQMEIEPILQIARKQLSGTPSEKSPLNVPLKIVRN